MAYSALARLWANKVMDETKLIGDVPERYLNDVISILKDNDRHDLLGEFGIKEEEEPDLVEETE